MSTAPASLHALNTIPPAEARAVLLSCCQSEPWADAVAAGRPYASADALHAAARTHWFALSKADWLAAFAHHPRIGERDITRGRSAADAAQAGREQSGMAAATDDQRADFLRGNAEYEHRFGHIFLICASGKSAADMLAALRARLANDPGTELANAAREQAAITRLRLERWLAS